MNLEKMKTVLERMNRKEREKEQNFYEESEKRKRGRPRKENPLTDAERQQRHRAKVLIHRENRRAQYALSLPVNLMNRFDDLCLKYNKRRSELMQLVIVTFVEDNS